jgi:hypothetical protein
VYSSVSIIERLYKQNSKLWVYPSDLFQRIFSNKVVLRYQRKVQTAYTGPRWCMSNEKTDRRHEVFGQLFPWIDGCSTLGKWLSIFSYIDTKNDTYVALDGIIMEDGGERQKRTAESTYLTHMSYRLTHWVDSKSR